MICKAHKMLGHLQIISTSFPQQQPQCFRNSTRLKVPPNTHPDMGLPRICLLKPGHSICLIHVEVYLHSLWVLLQPAGEHTHTAMGSKHCRVQVQQRKEGAKTPFSLGLVLTSLGPLKGFTPQRTDPATILITFQSLPVVRPQQDSGSHLPHIL